MGLEYRVYAVRPGTDEVEFFAAFALNRWQWAEKLGQLLRDKGCEQVEVRTVDEEEPDEEDDGV